MLDTEVRITFATPFVFDYYYYLCCLVSEQATVYRKWIYATFKINDYVIADIKEISIDQNTRIF